MLFQKNHTSIINCVKQSHQKQAIFLYSANYVFLCIGFRERQSKNESLFEYDLQTG